MMLTKRQNTLRALLVRAPDETRTRRMLLTNSLFEDQPAVYYKVQGDSVAKRSSGAWGSRGVSPNMKREGGRRAAS